TGFGKRHLLDQLPDMARAGLLDHTRDGRTHRFRARAEFLAAMEPIPARWVDWTSYIATLLELEDAMRILEANPTTAGAMDASRRISDHPDVVPVRFAPLGSPETLPDRLRDWLLTNARHVAAIDSHAANRR
ncbi:MAG: hypothetical protein KDI19_11435, partial [Pseudomonadales bacterium]|nr:hypothetical protein [Pseudomonadales bacterium]